MIEVKNFGTCNIVMANEGKLVTLKPGQSTYMDEKLYEAYVTVFPNLRPNIEHVIIESDEQEIEQPKAKKNDKGKKRGK